MMHTPPGLTWRAVRSWSSAFTARTRYSLALLMMLEKSTTTVYTPGLT
jgi:hypothetical protein